MQSVSDNTAINYDKSLENLISGASHLKETSHFFKILFFNALLYLQGGCCAISTPVAEPLACSEYHAVSSVGWCFSRADLMQLPSANIISGRWWCTGFIE